MHWSELCWVQKLTPVSTKTCLFYSFYEVRKLTSWACCQPSSCSVTHSSADAHMLHMTHNLYKTCASLGYTTLAFLDLRGNSSVHSPWSPDHKGSSMAVIAFTLCIFAKSWRWFCFLSCFLLGRTVWLCIFIVMQQTLQPTVWSCAVNLPPTWSHCGMGTDLYCGRAFCPPDRTILVTWPLSNFVVHWFCGALTHT